MAIPVFAKSPTVESNTPNIPIPFDLRAEVKRKVLEAGLDWNVINAIIQCESGFNPYAIGDHGTSVGLWQIHLPAHNLTKEQALDPLFSTDYAIKLAKSKRGLSHWTCYSNTI